MSGIFSTFENKTLCLCMALQCPLLFLKILLILRQTGVSLLSKRPVKLLKEMFYPAIARMWINLNHELGVKNLREQGMSPSFSLCIWSWSYSRSSSSLVPHTIIKTMENAVLDFEGASSCRELRLKKKICKGLYFTSVTYNCTVPIRLTVKWIILLFYPLFPPVSHFKGI